jgi:hypothetical protein
MGRPLKNQILQPRVPLEDSGLRRLIFSQLQNRLEQAE